MESFNTFLLLINSVVCVLCVHNLHSNNQSEFQQMSVSESEDHNNLTDTIYRFITTRQIPQGALKTAPDYIRGFGYPAEVHDVTTADGYILTMVRIPHGKTYKTVPKRKPVIIHHGLISDCTCWLANEEDKLLPLQLADLGFDVWLANARGTRYSRRHTKYTVKDKAFFDYSMDEIGHYDVPAEIDYVLQTTGERQIIWMGHSMGGGVFHIAMSRHPQYNEKVSLMVGMAPAVYNTNIGGTTKLLLLLGPVAADIVLGALSYGAGEFPAPSFGYIAQTAVLPISVVCSWKTLKTLCYFIEALSPGPANPGKTTNRWPTLISTHPSPTSLKVMKHFIQQINAGNFQHYDYGRSKNFKVYGTATPPLHKLNATTTPVGLFYGKTDYLVVPKDALRTASELANVVFLHEIKPKWNHLDFVIGSDANEKLHKYVLALALRY